MSLLTGTTRIPTDLELLYERVRRLEAALLDTVAGHICLLPLGSCAFCRLRHRLEARP